MTKLTKSEMETIISFGSLDKTANVWSNDPVWMKKLEKLGAKVTEDYAEIDVPKGWIKIQQK